MGDGGEYGLGDIPARINALPLRAPPQLLHSRRPDVGEVVRARGRDDGVPDDGAVGGLGALGGVGVRPLGRHVDEELLGVPGEEGGEVGVEGEADRGVLFFLGGVVVGAALVPGGLLAALLPWGEGGLWWRWGDGGGGGGTGEEGEGERRGNGGCETYTW